MTGSASSDPLTPGEDGDPRGPVVALLNAYTRHNIGDALLLENSLALLASIRPGRRVVVVASDPESFARAHGETRVVRSPVRPPPRIADGVGWLVAMATGARRGPPHLRALRDVEEAFSIGGGFLQVRGLRELFSVVLVHVSQLALIRRLGIRLVMLPQSVGPFETRAVRRAFVRVLRWFEVLMLREDDSLDRVREMDPGLVGRCVRAPDLAVLCARSPQPRTAAPQIRRVAISVRQWWFPGHPNRREAYRRYVRETARTAELLLERGHDVEFVVQSTGPGDRGDDRIATADVLHELGRELPVRTSPFDQPASTLIDGYRRFDLVLTTRMHAGLMALLAGTPCIAIGYEDKTHGVFRTLGLERWVVPIADATAPQLMALVDRVADYPLGDVAERLVAQRAQLIAAIGVLGVRPPAVPAVPAVEAVRR